MENINIEMKKFEEELSNFHIPRYEDLPDIELYMDQVLALINKQLFIISNNENVITPSMVNNYVKFGLIPSPKGKRYTRKHLCYMIALCFLKQILSMNEIKVLVKEQIKISNELDAYNLFCNELEIAFKNCCEFNLVQSQTNIDNNHCLIYCAKAIAYKLHTQKYIAIMASLSDLDKKSNKKSNDANKKTGEIDKKANETKKKTNEVKKKDDKISSKN